MKVDTDGETTEYDQVQEWRCVRADDQCWCLSMAITGGLPMTLEKSARVAD